MSHPLIEVSRRDAFLRENVNSIAPYPFWINFNCRYFTRRQIPALLLPGRNKGTPRAE